MTEENWNTNGKRWPPIIRDVLSRQEISHSNGGGECDEDDVPDNCSHQREVVYVRGYSPEGFQINGRTGLETVVVRDITDGVVTVAGPSDLDVMLLRKRLGGF